MKSFTFWTSFFFLLRSGSALDVPEASSRPNACAQIAAAISYASAVFYPGSAQYASDIDQFAGNSVQNSTCSVEPGTTQDVSKIMRILAQTRTPFGIKSSGHMHNPGFSSTKGVQISMVRFNDVDYSPQTKTVQIGSGILWVDVAKTLDPLGVGVLGGRCGGVAVGGYALGGGFSWKSSQYGLLIDTIVSVELVLPSGDIVTVTQANRPDLLFALKGGNNNFGIATKFVFKTFPQTAIYGGQLDYAPQYVDKVIAAAADFVDKNQDTKAQLYTVHAYAGGNLLTSAALFYDAPQAPPGKFSDFFNIPSVANSVATKPMSEMIREVGDFLRSPRWAADHLGLLDYTVPVVNEVVKQVKFWGQDCVAHGCGIFAILIEPFHANLWQQATPSAFPHGSNHAIYPCFVTFTWTDPAQDAYFHNAIKSAIAAIHQVAVNTGQDLSGLKDQHYSNYAMGDQPLELIFGESLQKLKSLKKYYDPNNVMGLAGGWKL